jgi:protein gp37
MIMNKTKIAWADRTWSPVDGCTKVSQGCKYCYADRLSQRFWGDRKFSHVTFHPDRLGQPGKVKKPQFVFVCPMGDLFHPDVSYMVIKQIFSYIKFYKQHTFLVLTKRPERIMPWITHYHFMDHESLLPKNLWLGVSVENQATANERIPLLLQTPAERHFVSCEPLLGPVDLKMVDQNKNFWLRDPDIPGTKPHIDWVIVGGESGPQARHMDVAWVRQLLYQCFSTGTKFWFKQWGKQQKGDILDGRQWHERPMPNQEYEIRNNEKA